MTFTSEFSKKHKITIATVIIIIIASTLPIFFDEKNKDNLFSKVIILVINLASLILLFWIILRTNYTIKNKNIICKSGPFKKEVPILNILKIELHKGIVVPTFWKLSLSDKGFIVHYNQFDDIYISPKNADKFLTELLKINPNIVIPTNV